MAGVVSRFVEEKKADEEHKDADEDHDRPEHGVGRAAVGDDGIGAREPRRHGPEAPGVRLTGSGGLLTLAHEIGRVLGVRRIGRILEG